MANRYWVGGTGTWDGTASTKWALTSGGAGGEAVPTSADDVFFDASSGANTVTISGSRVAKSITCTGFTGTLAGTATPALTISGNLTLATGMTVNYTGTTTFDATATITSNGKTLGPVTIDGSGITVTLGDALNLGSNTLTITQGTFTTSASNYSLSAGAISSNNANTRTITLNGSTVNLNGPLTINFLTTTNLTFNAGTSQINLSANIAFIGTSSGGVTFYNVSFTGTGEGNRQISTGANTFNNLSITTSFTGLSILQLGNDQTVNGTLTCAGSSVTQRGFVRSNSIAATRTITANAISANDCDFRDITLAGTAAGASPTRAGDCGGNSGITFPAAKTVYWNLAGTQNWNATAWATTSNGTPAVNNFPLAQDTATFTNSGSADTIAFSTPYNTGTINALGRTVAMTLNHNASHNIYGSYTLDSGITVSGTSGQNFNGSGTQTFTSAGKTITYAIGVDKPATTFQLGDAITVSNTITHSRGIFNANNYNVTCTTFASNNSNTRTITMGSGTWTLSGTGTVWNLATTTGLTFNKNTANIVLSDTSTTARTFAGGGLTYNNLTIGGATGTSTLTITGTNTFDTLASTKTVAHTITFPNSTTTVSNWTITGTVGNVVTLTRTGASGTFTLAKSGGGVISGVDYLSISNSTASPTNTWYAGANSTNGGGNTNWLFTIAPSTVNSNFFFFM